MRFTSNVTASWSLMPGVVCVGDDGWVRGEYEVQNVARFDACWVVYPNSLIISSSLLFASCSGVCRLLVIPVYVR